MASRHDIIHIDFEANAGKVSPALKAIQNSAADTRKAVQGVEQELKNLEKAGADKTAIEAKRKELRGLERDVKSLEQAEREYVKGIGTLDKAIKAFNDGTLSQMSAAFQKASYNAAKLAQTKLVPADKDYKKSMEELNALMQRNMENMAKQRMQTDDLLKAIESGGKVSASWLRTEKQNLEELLDVIPRGTAEWKQYNDQLTKIKDHVQTLSETERRLAGEIVNANDARQMAAQLTAKGAAEAKKAREEAEITISQRERNIEKLEQERQKRLETAQALSKQVADEANEIELKKQAIAVMEEEAKVEGETAATKKKMAEDARTNAETLKQAAKEEAENLELQKKATQGAADEVARLKVEIEKLNAEPVKPQVDVSQVEELQGELDKVNKTIAKLKSGAMYDPSEGSIDNAIKDRLKKAKEHSDEADKWMDKARRTKEGTKNNEEYLYNWSDSDQWRQSFEDQAAALKKIEPLLKQKAGLEQKIAEAQQQSTAATQAETKSSEELQSELDGLNKRLKEKHEWQAKQEGYLNESLDKLKQLGLKEEDLSDEAKVREATEKKVLEILEAQAKVEQEVAEQQKAAVANLKDTALGGTKADHDYYIKNRGNYALEDYATPDDAVERIAHLERLSRLKNGKRFDPYEDWEDEYDLDEDSPVMNDKEREDIKNEMRVLKQHVRETIVKAIREAGDFDKGVENATGGEGVSEDAKFGEELNDKINALKDKIFENIKTTVESYSDLLDDEIDREIPMTKEELTSRIKGVISYTGESLASSRQDVQWAKEDVEEVQGEIEAKQKQIELTKQGTAATAESVEVDKQKEQLQQQLKEAEEKHAQELGHLEQQQKNVTDAETKATKADEEAKKQEQELAQATGETSKKLQEERTALESMESAHDGNIKKLQQEQQALQEYDNQIQQEAGTMQEAEIKKAQNQELTVKRMEEIVAMLEKENHDTIPANTEEWKKNKQTIDELTEKIREAKGESMSLEHAMELAAKAGKEGFDGSATNLRQAEQAIQKAVDGATKGSDKWREYKAALAAVRLEVENSSITHERMMEILKDPSAAANLGELNNAVKRGTSTLRAMEETVNKDSEAYKELAKQVKQAAIEQKNMESEFKASAGTFEKAWSRLKTYVSLYVGAAVAMQKITATMGDLMELSDKMGEVRKTTGWSADEVGRLSDNLKKLDVRTTMVQLLDLSAAAGQLGLKSQEAVEGFTKSANMLMVALPEMGREAATSLMKIADATGDLKKNGGDVEETLQRVGSTIIALRANSASAAPAITDFVSRVGAVGAQAGISIDQIAALGSTIDALGGRVEMSATALSRMIPAIRNNAFGVANAIGVTEKTLTDLFNQGKAMEAMVLIFQKMSESVKRFDTSTEEGMNAMADNVEALLGKNAAMGEVMKELNQQGARAGIVFGLLSQNVDKLEEQLRTAGKAYSENTALLNEFNNMNETTAAKWARFKNQLEEMWVSDNMQRRLGWIIDRLRDIVNIISDDGPLGRAVRFMIYSATMVKIKWTEAIGSGLISLGNWVASLFKSTAATTADTAATTANTVAKTANAAATTSMGAAEEGAAVKTEALTNAQNKQNKAMKANVIGLVVTALVWLGMKMLDAADNARKAAAEIGNFNQQLHDEKKALDDLFTPLQKSNLAQDERSKLITEINSKYSKYLGYMLSETTQAVQLAEAHALIAKRIREEAYEKRILEQEDKIRDKYDKNINEAYAGITSAVRNGAKGEADVQGITDFLKDLVDKNIDKVTNVREVGDVGGGRIFDLDPEFRRQLTGALDRLVADGQVSKKSVSLINGAVSKYILQAKDQHDAMMEATQGTRADLRNVQNTIKGDVNANLNRLTDNIKNFGGKTPEGVPTSIARGEPTLSEQTWEQKMGGSRDWIGNANVQANTQVPGPTWQPNVNKKNVEEVKQFVYAQDQLRSYLEANAKNIDEQTRKTAEMYLLAENEMEELRKLLPAEATGGTGGGGGGGTNPYGNFNRVTDEYGKWDADSLVARRKEMLERVRALANGADVQKVLSEDAKFISEATRKNIKDTKQAIEWYNTERLKIQDALHERYLTNTGDWMDPKKGGKKASKQVQDEMKYYLDELDAYYTERKAMIQEARNDEQITEAEAWRRALQNDAEWRQRRAELQQLYAKKSEKVTQEEQDAILDILSERTGDSIKYIQKDIDHTVKFIEKVGEQKGKPAMDAILGDLDKDIEQDFLRQRTAIGKQMQAIADIINRERPFNGITENLQENLTKMGVLQADFEKRRLALIKERKDTSELDKEYEAEIPKRLAFMLTEAEHAYNTNIEEVMKRMADNGMEAWAEEIRKSPMMQEAVMGQLHNIFDRIQEAIKKEANQWKKEAEIMWNNILMPDGKSTLKQAADKAVALLSLEQGKVSRANSMIGAGQASERVADKLAIQQMKIELAMEEHRYNLMRKRGLATIKDLERQAQLAKERGDIEEATRKTLDKQHAEQALNLVTSKEGVELAKQREEIVARTEESERRLYDELRSWAELLASSLQSVFEASNAGNEEYYNEMAKLRLTGSNGKGGQYIIIDNAGTSDAEAHYETLSDEEYLNRMREIEQQNATAEAWKKVMDEFNQKMNDMITDQINAMLQNASVDANTQALASVQAALDSNGSKIDAGQMSVESNTDATKANTEAIAALTEKLSGDENGLGNTLGSVGKGLSDALLNKALGGESGKTPIVEVDKPEWDGYDYGPDTKPEGESGMPLPVEDGENASFEAYKAKMEASSLATNAILEDQKKILQGETKTDQQIQKSSQSMFAKMTQAANLYGVAYAAVSNENMSWSQKFGMIAVQAAGNAAITMLTTKMTETTASTAADSPAVLSKLWKQLGWAAVPVFAIFTGLLGGLMGLASSAIGKGKSEIASITGANNSVASGKLATGMLTYAEGNVNEFTDPGTLTEGRSYNVDAADGKTYRAKYMGKDAKTHITTGPEFHLVGEKGREAIIDAKTTRNIQLNDPEIWRSIQILYNGGSVSRYRPRRGIRAFAEGNLDDEIFNGQSSMFNESSMDMAAMTAALDRQTAVQEALLERLSSPIKAEFNVYGPKGLIDSYDTGKKTAQRHGQRY